MFMRSAVQKLCMSSQYVHAEPHSSEGGGVVCCMLLRRAGHFHVHVQHCPVVHMLFCDFVQRACVIVRRHTDLGGEVSLKHAEHDNMTLCKFIFRAEVVHACTHVHVRTYLHNNTNMHVHAQCSAEVVHVLTICAC